MEVTEGHLLGGRVRYAQPRDGYRTGIEPVLLAASVPAQPGERVLEAGAGAGAGLLCLAARVPGVVGVGVELDPAMADLARRNLRANGAAGLEVVTGDIADVALETFDHAFANPPWHDPRSTPSPVERRRLAKQGEGLEVWIAALTRMLKPGGSLSLILPATPTARAVEALAQARVGHVLQQPLLPKAGRPAKIILLQARAGEERFVTHAAIVLHEEDGSFTEEADAVLRHGGALWWDVAHEGRTRMDCGGAENRPPLAPSPPGRGLG